jgi:hypothetical protein
MYELGCNGWVTVPNFGLHDTELSGSVTKELVFK